MKKETSQYLDLGNGQKIPLMEVENVELIIDGVKKTINLKDV